MRTVITFPRQPKQRLDFAGGFRFTRSPSQTVVQIGSKKGYFQVMTVPRKGSALGTGFLHVMIWTSKRGKLFWLRLSTKWSLWLIRLWKLELPRATSSARVRP